MAAKVKPVPEGYHTVTAFMIVKDAREVMDFYSRAFGAETVMRMPGPDGKSTMHAEMRIGDSMLMLCDENPNWNTKSAATLGGSPVSLHLYVNDADAAFKRAVQAGCTVTMPIQDAFWGDRYGKLRDPFGYEWGIATHKEDLSPEELDRRAAEFMKSMGG
jgi:uncharacterized glyoxalase superfamily protein PhnB